MLLDPCDAQRNATVRGAADRNTFTRVYLNRNVFGNNTLHERLLILPHESSTQSNDMSCVFCKSSWKLLWSVYSVTRQNRKWWPTTQRRANGRSKPEKTWCFKSPRAVPVMWNSSCRWTTHLCYYTNQTLDMSVLPTKPHRPGLDLFWICGIMKQVINSRVNPGFLWSWERVRVKNDQSERRTLCEGLFTDHASLSCFRKRAAPSDWTWQRIVSFIPAGLLSVSTVRPPPALSLRRLPLNY